MLGKSGQQDNNPRLARDEIRIVREKHESRFRHRAMGQTNRPHQSQQTQSNEIERSCHRSTCSMPSIGWRQGVLLRRFHGVSPKVRNSARIHLPIHSATKWSSRAQKSAHPRSSAGHDKREAYAQVILGRSCEYGRLPIDPVHNIRSARGHAARKILREEAGLIPTLGVSAQLHTCTYPTRSGKS